MLTAQVMKHFHIEKDWSTAGFFETSRLRQLEADVRTAIIAGRLVAITGPVGVGETVMFNKLQNDIAKESKIIVARSLSIDKPRVLLPALITALFLDISKDLDIKVPTHTERRERALQLLVQRAKKPVALFIDEAHDLHASTLTGLKRLKEIIKAGQGVLSVILVGHPRLHNDLKRAVLEEIGHRVTKFEYGGLGDDKSSYINWLLSQCLVKNTKPDTVITPEARDFLAESLSTPLQISEHLDRAFSDAYRLGEALITLEIVEETMSTGFNDLDARLARVGYTPKALSEQFEVRLPEIRRFLKGKLDTERTEELGTAMRRAGLPI